MSAPSPESHVLREREISRSGITEFDQSPWRRALLFFVAIKIAGLILIVDPYGLQAFDLPKSVFSHVTAGSLCLLVIATLAQFGLGVIPRTRLHLAVAGLFVANVISASAAANTYIAVFGDQGRYLGLTFVLDMIVLYAAVAIAFRTVEDWRALLATVGTATAFVLFYAVVQALGWDPIIWAKSSNEQPFSTFGHPDIFGHFLSIAFGISLGVAAATTGSIRFRVLGFAAAFIFVVFASVVATRGTLLGIAAALVLFATLKLREGGRRPAAVRESVLIGAISLAVLLVIVAYTPLGTRVLQVVEDEGSGRLSFYASAIRATLARPIVGFGPDNFGVAYPAFREPPPNGPVDPLNSAHNWLLQAAATTGVVGLLALVAVVGSFGVFLVRVAVRRVPVIALPLLLGYVAYWTHALVTVGSVAVDWFPWVCYGVIASVAGEGTRRASPVNRWSRLTMTFAASLLVVGVASLVMPWGTLQANRNAGRARADWTQGLSAETISAAETAVRFDAGRAEYWNWLGLGFDQAGRPRSAGDAFQEAASRAPHEARYWLNLALARARQALAGDDRDVARPAALDAAARAVAADPYAPGFNEGLTDIALQLGDFDVALRSAVTNTLVHEGYGPAGYEAFLIAQRVSDLPTARQVLKNAIAIRETAQFRLALAEIALRMNDRADARMNALRALELKPGDDDALQLLAQSQR